MTRRMATAQTTLFSAPDGGFVCGVDEAGRGPWAGPVVAAAVILDTRRMPAGIADSKTLTEKQREAAFISIIDHCITYAAGVASVAEIDELNILQATFLAMQRAVAGLTIKPSLALIDGNLVPPLPCEARAIVGGDAIEPAISAASIVAKVLRDRMMVEMHAAHPHYGWASNKGYGTAEHQEALTLHGVTAHHRRSFKPIEQHLVGAGGRDSTDSTLTH
jgi:ribonuclease HII